MDETWNPLLNRLETLLLEALPPLYRKVRPAVVNALAQRLTRHWRPAAEVSTATLIPALRELIRTLQPEVTSVEAAAAELAREFNEASDEPARRRVLLRHIEQTVPLGRERRKDARALKRWMGFDALKERLEGQRQRLLVQEEMALRVLRGALVAAPPELQQRVRAELPAVATLLLDRALQSPRTHNQLAALDALVAALRLLPEALASTPEALATLTSIAERTDASPWLQAAALEALLMADRDTGLPLLRTRAHRPNAAPRDFLFRRQLLEIACRTLSGDTLRMFLVDIGRADPSEYVRMAVCELLPQAPDPIAGLRDLAGLSDSHEEKSPRVRGAAVLTAATQVQSQLAGWREAAQLIARVIEQDGDALVLRLACDQVSRLSDVLCDETADAERTQLVHAVTSVWQRAGMPGPVVESAAQARLSLLRAADPSRRAWAKYLRERVRAVAPGGRLKLKLSPPPAGLPPLPADANWLGGILADLSSEDFGLYADREGDTLILWRGDQFERRSWRVMHEATRPAPNKRQGHRHTLGRRVQGTFRAHPAHLDEVTSTTVPGERVHVASEGSWGRHLPTVDDLLDLPLTGGKDVRIFSSHGVTTLSPPLSLSRRVKNRLKLTRHYEHFSALRLGSLQGAEARERSRYVDAIERELGVGVSFTPYQPGECAPERVRALFGNAVRDANTPLHSLAPLALLEGGSWLPTVTDVLLERNDYFLGMRGNGILALAVFTAGLFSVFLADAYRKREAVRTARARVPLCIGGWGTRGKSGTERLKAALFTGLGFEVFAKTTGSEAMFVHSAPGGAPHEFFIYRPYDKATIWEQKDMLQLGARLGVEVFLWECMALQPGFVELLQNDWMHDDVATLTNAYPDHEDIQGPAGHDVAQVITNFMPEGGKVVTTEDHFLPLFREAARKKGTTLLHSPWWEAELIPEELLNLFPYREHPRNMALVATMAEDLGISRPMALGLMAEHVQPEIGVLKVFPRARVRGRTLTFINGHSANERTGFINNWRRTGLDKVDPDVDPDRAVITVINNRWDRVARSEVFARIMVEDAPADRHVLIGTNLEGLQKYVRDALDDYLSRRELVTADELGAGSDGLNRAWERLGRELAHLKVPLPRPELFFDRLARSAAGAGLELSPTQALTEAVERLLRTDDGELRVQTVRATLRTALAQALEASLRTGAVSEDPALPETVEAAGREEVKEHALWALARMVVHARLRMRLARASGSAEPLREVTEVHRAFRSAYRELFLEQLVPVNDPLATGDQIVDVCARSVAPGLEVSIMGAQNIKGTGLDWVYRWLALDKVSGALKALESGGPEDRRRALEFLETFEDNGLVDTGLAQAALPQLAQQAPSREEAERLSQLAARLRAVHEVKLSALTHARSGSRFEQAVRSFEKVFDYLDSVRRRKLADQLVDDLVHGRVSHARAAVETRKLYERQKGGWLWSKLRPAKDAPAALPTPTKVPALPVPQPHVAIDRPSEAANEARDKDRPKAP